MNEHVIDAFELCKREDFREGELAVARLERLAREAVDGSGTLKWSLSGGRNRHGQAQLSLAIAGEVNLMCQRCLKPMTYVLDSKSELVLAPDEQSADELDELLADEDVEVITGSPSMNLLQLVEDEALLALPLSPRHPECESAGGRQAPQTEDKPSPFAVLKNLKH